MHIGRSGLCVTRPSATSGPANLTQVISPQLHSGDAHSQDGNHALHSLDVASWLFNSSHFSPISVYFSGTVIVSNIGEKKNVIPTVTAPVIIVEGPRYFLLMCVWFVLFPACTSVCMCVCV